MDRRVLGDYNVIKQIGQGSLGTLFLAEHRFIKRQYALKVLPEEFVNDRGFIHRFEEEVKHLVSLEHQHIVKVHNVSFAHGVYFLVTDCIVDSIGETTNLAHYVSSMGNGFSENELVRLLKQIASALDYIHSRNLGDGTLIHRGLKLNNVLVGQDNNGIAFFLSDCGLSRIIGAGAVLSRTYKAVADALSISPVVSNPVSCEDNYSDVPVDAAKLSRLHTSFLQNFAFLAPEQKIIGNGQHIGPAVDVYAFGVLAYYLIAKEFPEGIFEMPSVKKPEYRLNWDWLITTCMQKDYNKRPENLTEALEELLNRGKTTEIAKRVTLAEALSNNLPEKVLTSSKIFEEKKEERKPELVAVIGEKTLREEDCEQKELKPIIQTCEIKRPQYDPDPAAAFHVDSVVKHYQPEPVEKKIIEPILSEMVVIKGGVFYRGSTDGNRDEMPHHKVSLKSFAMDIHPITNEQFIRFLESMGGEKDVNNKNLIKLKESRILRRSGNLSIETGYAKHPIVGITWYGAAAYAKWIGKRLPTEAEWEVVARGNDEANIFSSGDDIEKNQANFFSSDTTVVKSYAPNSYGFYDMAGNVYEWCQDWYGYNYYKVSTQDPDNPSGPLQGVYRVLRGGCWKSLKEDLRCSHRHRNNPGTVNRTYGFRCAADVA